MITWEFLTLINIAPMLVLEHSSVNKRALPNGLSTFEQHGSEVVGLRVDLCQTILRRKLDPRESKSESSCRPACSSTILGSENVGNAASGSFSLSHLQQCAHHDPDHVMQKCVCPHSKNDDGAPLEQLDGLDSSAHRALPLTLGRTKRCEVMGSKDVLGRLGHGVNIQRL